MKNVSDTHTTNATDDVVQTARDRGQHVKETVTQEASRAVDSIKTAALEQADRQKNEIAGSLKSVDEALRQTSSEMDNPALAPKVEMVADAISQVHQFIEEHDVEDLGTAVRQLSLRHPVLFYSGVFAIGFVAGRFLSSTESRDEPDMLSNSLASHNQALSRPTVAYNGPY
jgi:hypothetical protein